MNIDQTCIFCREDGGRVLWGDGRCRVIVADEPGYPGFCRVVWNRHVREMTDLDADDREHIMQVVFTVEKTLRELMRPDKINLASLGNVVPHLHWHVVPRYADDAHFPDPVWSARRRDGAAHPLDTATLAARLREALGGGEE